MLSSLPISKFIRRNIQSPYFKTFARKCCYSTLLLEDHALRSLYQSFREYGHLEADIYPLAAGSLQQNVPELGKEYFASMLQTNFLYKDMHNWSGEAVYNHMRSCYCGKIGYEFTHLSSVEEKKWLANWIESAATEQASPADICNAFVLIQMSDTFEIFLSKKYPSFKRYSGEGSEAMYPCISTILQLAAAERNQISDVVIGMPHRGRLALLVSLLEYPAHKLFHKINGNSEFPPDNRGVDDVTSHVATSIDKRYGDSKVHVSLLHNPSHLEIINSVANGKTRAKIDRAQNALTLLIHGDAAFSGQGCVSEALSLSQLPGYSVNGSIHVIVNNQVGFTTAYPSGRSSKYCSDIAKAFDIPVIHVNGESIRDVINASQLAVEFRQKFKKDIAIDLVSYRRHGHNEVDEPRFTQPKLYAEIDTKERLSQTFGMELQKDNLMASSRIQKLQRQMEQHLEEEYQKAKSYSATDIDAFQTNWAEIKQPSVQDLYSSPVTGKELDTLIDAGLASVQVPAHISVHERLERTFIRARRKMLSLPADEIKVDWATAEAIAFGTLLSENYSVRLSGQDCQRGTFSHRHSALTDQNSGVLFFPLKHWSQSHGKFTVVNSNLSELAVMGFEYGYSWEHPRNLVLWEAQFGDFNNGAQIIIDQFLASGESKWMRQSGLVLLLPHGYDGAGPDHSSGKLERFLQLVDSPALDQLPKRRKSKDVWHSYMHDTNLIVVNITTPANYYHLLRRQQLRCFRKPVVVMAPKTLLRLPDATSSLREMGPGTSFQAIYPDESVSDPSTIKRIIFCSGKIYYSLTQQRRSLDGAQQNEIAIIRLEELAPFPLLQVNEQMCSYKNVKRISWVQEEPLNQGAWTYVRPHLEKVVRSDVKIDYIGRESLPAAAVGLSKRHLEQQKDILERAMHALIVPI